MGNIELRFCYERLDQILVQASSGPSIDTRASMADNWFVVEARSQGERHLFAQDACMLFAFGTRCEICHFLLSEMAR